LIKTVTGRGYRFDAQLSVEPEPQAPGKLAPGDPAGKPAPMDPDTAAPAWRRPLLLAGASAVVAFVAAALFAAWWWGGADAEQRSAPPFSIVVLPFENLGNESDDYFAEGITSDLSTELSRLPGLFVIAHATARSLKDKLSDMRQVGRDLGVRYLLQGSVRRDAGRLRLNIQLVSSDTGASVWAERFERRDDELSAWQDEVVGRITTALNYRLTRLESDRGLKERRGNPQAADLAVRGWAQVYSAKHPDRYLSARALFEQALERDPEAVHALAGLGWTSAVIVLDGWSTSPAEDVATAEDAAARALALEPNHFVAHHVRGFVLRLQRRPEAAREAFRTAIAINPNFAPGHAQVGATELALGEPAAAIAAVQRAIRLSPRDPSLGPWLGILGSAELHRGNDRQAAVWLARAIDTGTPIALNHAYLASALAHQGRQAEAREALAEFRERMPAATITGLRVNARSKETRFVTQQERLFEGLRMAGLTE
jgi:TolB-like protein/Tfp pilus assembly protein PilF